MGEIQPMGAKGLRSVTASKTDYTSEYFTAVMAGKCQHGIRSAEVRHMLILRREFSTAKEKGRKTFS